MQDLRLARTFVRAFSLEWKRSRSKIQTLQRSQRHLQNLLQKVLGSAGGPREEGEGIEVEEEVEASDIR
jgi:hypothetical protein